jgi:hypothetical protein
MHTSITLYRILTIKVLVIDLTVLIRLLLAKIENNTMVITENILILWHKCLTCIMWYAGMIQLCRTWRLSHQ